MADDSSPHHAFPRREFLRLSALAVGGAASWGTLRAARDAGGAASAAASSRSPYRDEQLGRIAFPLGGLGAGMICLEGAGAISHVSVRHRPELFNEPCFFAALALPGAQPNARVLEGPVPGAKIFGGEGDGEGAVGTTYGLPRFEQAEFTPRFPFATVTLRDATFPVRVEVTGWSPFTPGDADSSSLPVAAIEYRFTNTSAQPVAAVFSYNAKNFLPARREERQGVRSLPRGFALWTDGPADQPWGASAFAVSCDAPETTVNHAWFRGGWWDPLMMAWRDVEQATPVERAPIEEGEPSPGGSLFVPVSLRAGETRSVVVRLAWYTPRSSLRTGRTPDPRDADAAAPATHVPWYAGQFRSIDEVAAMWDRRYAELRQRSATFADCFFSSTLPAELTEAVAANLAILKSPTVLRQADGRFWAWEGSGENAGRGDGTCTHVWNYAQALAHLFPALERTIRETEFGPGLDEKGHQAFRVPLPIRPATHGYHAAADGQLGGVMKLYRDWRISGDTAWLRSLWPQARRSLDYCIATWDPERRGWLEEPHHNTYDVEFWGPDGMCTSIYLGALRAAVAMGEALGDEVAGYRALAEAARRRLETELFDGDYFVQRVEWRNRRAGNPVEIQSFELNYSAEARELLEREGPKYQYGAGCLSDGVIGAWLGEVCGVGEILDPTKVRRHLLAVHRHNFRRDLSHHVNPQRPGYALGREGGLLLCSWPKGGKPALPFIYSNEVWTGIEYQVASHLLAMGAVAEGVEIVRTCRQRYDGRVRNPFDEYEFGHWYARALASYALLQGWSGARYDAVEKVLSLRPRVRGDFRCFLATATGYGTVGVRDGEPFFDVAAGAVEVRRIDYVAAS